ncbi:MAG: type II toxin-antitoxin system RelE/ParE family toxin [Oscillospiraceae bacterium]|nr:type II toxin-antitoxin system RelE/ParE family toxin [Oscillospiraceae bacterium]
MYRLEFLPSARNDLVEIVQYISRELGNPSAAYDLADELIAAAEKIVEFPYASPAHTPIRPLKHEYRRGRIKNYYLFYWIDEQKKCVTLARVIYARRDYDRELS